MSLNPKNLWRAGSIVLAMGVAALGLWAWSSGALWALQMARGEEPDHDAVSAILLIVLAALYAAGHLWIAWRLLRHWGAGTVRLVSAVGVVYAGLFAFGELAERLAALETEAYLVVFNVLTIALMLLMAVAYRKLSRSMIRWARLQDPRDPHGYPPGHVERARFFCAVLGFCVWLAAQQAGLMLAVGSFTNLLVLFGSVALGILVYHVVLWRMTPRVVPAQPPEHAFEVIAPREVPEAQTRE